MSITPLSTIAEQLSAAQAPLKSRYREQPDAAKWVLRASGRTLQGSLACDVDTHLGTARAGLHPATGGDGTHACSGDMLLQALVGCAGVTLAAVATAIGVTIRDVQVSAEGDLDFRGTLGVDKTTTVGFTAIRLQFRIATDANDLQLGTLQKLTERYCVVYQTLAGSVAIETEFVRNRA